MSYRHELNACITAILKNKMRVCQSSALPLSSPELHYVGDLRLKPKIDKEALGLFLLNCHRGFALQASSCSLLVCLNFCGLDFLD